MAEYIGQQCVWKEASPGAMLDNSFVRRELFLLISIFLANQRINTQVRHTRIPDLANEHSVEEVTRLLAVTASILRARDDYAMDEVRRTGEGAEWLKELQTQTCGTLQRDVTKENRGAHYA